MNQPLPATWRRLALKSHEYEWLAAYPLPRSCAVFKVLVHHQNHQDVRRASVFVTRTEALSQVPVEKDQTARVLRGVPQAEGAPARPIGFDALLRELYLPRLFTTYGFDRRLLGEALCAELPQPLHHWARQTARVYLFELRREAQTARDRAAAVKKPRAFRDVARAAGKALYKLADRADTWLWGRDG